MNDFKAQAAMAEAIIAKHNHLDHVHGPNCNHGHDHHHHSVAETFVRAVPKVGRNEPCPCGSGKKHKKCCLA